MGRDELEQALRTLGWVPTDRLTVSRNPFTGDLTERHRKWTRGSREISVPDLDWVAPAVARRVLFNARRR